MDLRYLSLHREKKMKPWSRSRKETPSRGSLYALHHGIMFLLHHQSPKGTVLPCTINQYPFSIAFCCCGCFWKKKPKNVGSNPRGGNPASWIMNLLLQWSALKIMCNKKVLLRERKRHTARCVANTRYVVLTGYPPGGVPGQVPPRGVRVPPRGVPGQVPPGGGTWSGTPPGGTQTPPPPCGQTNTCENSTFPSYYVRGR